MCESQDQLHVNWEWWWEPAIAALGKQRQGGQECKVVIGHITRLRPEWAIGDPVSNTEATTKANCRNGALFRTTEREAEGPNVLSTSHLMLCDSFPRRKRFLKQNHKKRSPINIERIIY